MGFFGRSKSPASNLSRKSSIASHTSSVSVSASAPAPIRVVLLGQHPTKIAAVVKLLHGNEHVQVIAAVSDLQDAAVVVVGGYFELDDVVAQIGRDLTIVKVPDGLMMTGGGPPVVVAYIIETLLAMRRKPSVVDSLEGV
ncbi:hypothetical protein RQP46_008146 [Phenoliferia psychrophenolica]